MAGGGGGGEPRTPGPSKAGSKLGAHSMMAGAVPDGEAATALLGWAGRLRHAVWRADRAMERMFKHRCGGAGRGVWGMGKPQGGKGTCVGYWVCQGCGMRCEAQVGEAGCGVWGMG